MIGKKIENKKNRKKWLYAIEGDMKSTTGVCVYDMGDCAKKDLGHGWPMPNSLERGVGEEDER